MLLLLFELPLLILIYYN